MVNSQKTGLVRIIMYFYTRTRYNEADELHKTQIFAFKDLSSLGGSISVKVLVTWFCFSVLHMFLGAGKVK